MTKTTIKPLGERVLVEPLEREETTKAGIIIPDSAKEKPQEGRVLAVGSRVKELKAGDRVLFSTYNGDEIKLEQRELKIIEEKDILGKLT